MSIYRYRKIDRKNLDSWRKNKLWFSPIDELDDGFEMWCNLDSQGLKALDKLLQNQIGNYLDNQKEEYRKKLAFCCFSENANILLMWALYGDGLRGICIEYDESALKLNNKLIDVKDIWRVDYPPDTSLPYVDIYQCHIENNFEGVDKKILATKFEDWRHQEEVRLIWRSENKISEGIPVDINRESVKSIIFGERADPNKVKLIKEIFGQSMTYKIAKRSASHYKIEIVDHPSP